jgi:hypothetical protein
MGLLGSSRPKLQGLKSPCQRAVTRTRCWQPKSYSFALGAKYKGLHLASSEAPDAIISDALLGELVVPFR